MKRSTTNSYNVGVRTIPARARSKRLRETGGNVSVVNTDLKSSTHTHNIEDINELKAELEKRLLKTVFDENFSVTDALVEVLKNWKVKGNGCIDGNLRVLGETFTYSADGIETFEDTGGGAEYLWELVDVEDTVKDAEDGSMLVKNAGVWQGVDTISIDCGNYKIV